MAGSNVIAACASGERLSSSYGPWAVVTGASDGIGRAMAIELATAGINLVLVARRRELLEMLASDLRAAHRVDTRVLPIDLAQPTAAATIANETSALGVGLLAAVAGFGTSGDLVDLPLDGELEMIDVNCRAVVDLSHRFAGRFVKQRRGGIVLMSSLLAFQGVPRAATYAATKAFIQTFAEGLRLELRRFDVDVVASAPGPVRSGFESRADMRMSAAADPAMAARRTLAALGRRGIVRPGLLSKVLEASLTPLPRSGRSRIMGLVMRGMTRHQDGGKGRQERGPA